MLGTQTQGVHAGNLRYLALGDSYTIGEAVAETLRWPQQLAVQLRQNGFDIADPRILARTGWTTDELAAAMDAERFDPPYDLVSLSIGVNNQYRGRSADEYRNEFVDLLRRAIALAGDRPTRVFVVSIPDWGVTRFGRGSGRDLTQISAELDAFNAINRTEAQRLGAGWADVSALSRAQTDDASQLADDGLHPSGAQYTRWLRTILPAARNALGANTAR
ncbi:MAG: SGNH/GDSL hydrolase family protein [Tahibacter sp.]